MTGPASSSPARCRPAAADQDPSQSDMAGAARNLIHSNHSELLCKGRPGQRGASEMRIVTTAFAVWRSWWTLVARSWPVLVARIDALRDDRVDSSETRAPELLFAQPVLPAIDLKAARVRSEPAGAAGDLRDNGRSRVVWTPDLDAELLRLVADDTSTVDIASKLGRSEKAVLLRIPLLRLRQRQNG
jgi:hypothetical protein